MDKSSIEQHFIALGKAMHPDNPIWVEKGELAQIHNPWFTSKNIRFALSTWSRALAPSEVASWLDPIKIADKPLNIGLIMAGNIPLVGLHDLLCVLGTGHQASVKLSSSDTILMKEVIGLLVEIHPGYEDKIRLVENVKGVDAVIATGSNNTSRYFEYYFKNTPHIIRKNRTGVAIISGNESTDQLSKLGDDIFTYFGMGCRNVTRLFVPENYDFTPMIQSWEDYVQIIDHHRYANNFTYHKAIFLMNLDKHLDTGFVLMKQDQGLHAPLSCIFYSFYKDLDEVDSFIRDHQEEIQVVVGDNVKDSIPFGSAQNTGLEDYADGINVISFLQNL